MFACSPRHRQACAPASVADTSRCLIGEEATEIIHIGHAVIALGGTIEYFRDNVFNYPTFAEAYKVAAYDGFNKIAGVG